MFLKIFIITEHLCMVNMDLFLAYKNVFLKNFFYNYVL